MKASGLRTFIVITSLTTFIFLNTGCAAKFDYKDPIVNMPMVFVKGGTYMMGSIEFSSEQPIHEVTIPDLFVGIFEVTFDQYDKFCKVTNCEAPSDEEWGRGNRPVINVSWHDANAYAAWLSEQTGQTFRLPTEAEWEYFARAGTTTKYWTGDTLLKGSANCSTCGSKWDKKMTSPVGSFKPNPWRIYDTFGNVTEWLLDDYNRNYKNAPTDGSAWLTGKTERKVQRGGAWSYPTTDLRSASRDERRPQSQNNDTGFRLVLQPSSALPAPHLKK